MRITLDYYRILNVSIKADLATLERAYQDRLQQQPRYEYSHEAIANRKRVLEQAYLILSDPEKRAEYDNNFFATIKSENIANIANIANLDLSAESNKLSEQLDNLDDLDQAVFIKKAPTIDPYIEIEPEFFVGILMILHELAEYEIVLRLGTKYLQELELEQSQNINSPYLNSNTATESSVKIQQKPDILLCLALSYLDLGREQWQREEFENAAISGNKGIQLLQQENSLFPRLQREIEEELNLLKPYRVLELLGQNSPGSSLRLKGLELLQEMLLQQEEIAGKSQNISGLKSDQFLCFIQQIRNYLTLQEQKEVFLAETKRGSSPGSCVAAYALIAEGFANKKPSSILQAQKILQNLSDNYKLLRPKQTETEPLTVGQNTDWERAVCALLLGQTLESQTIIQQSEDTKTLELIKQYSAESPDLLPGLCFYGQQWLQKKVLAQFHDLKLKSSQITLADYFNDPSVQAYIEKISPITYPNQQPNYQKNPLQPISSQPTSHQKSTIITEETKEQTKLQQIFPWWGNKKSTIDSNQAISNQTNYSQPKTQTTSSALFQTGFDNIKTSSNVANNAQKTQLPIMANSSHNNNINTNKIVKQSATSFLSNKHQQTLNKTNASANKSPKSKHQKSKKVKNTIYWKRGIFLLGLIGGLGALSFVLTEWGLKKSSKKPIVVESVTPPPNSETTPQLTTPSAKTPETTPEVAVKPPTTDIFNQELARKVIQTWLDSKAIALGQKYEIDRLDSILTGSLLKQWRDTSTYYKQNNIYRQFEHSLKIRAYQVNPENPNLATVDAEVEERAKHYQKGQLNQNQSYSDRLLVRYELVRQNGLWLIKNNQVLQSL